ncbi:hypothetical protein C8R47DRAFT_1113052 [Mycena vitilis]|nr:hypothetical protein C8R47DRAFT_1113052 [Mycena vitilis]
MHAQGRVLATWLAGCVLSISVRGESQDKTTSRRGFEGICAPSPAEGMQDNTHDYVPRSPEIWMKAGILLQNEIRCGAE